ncbi:hypothetical protein [Desulfurispira natronophila]|nr:hypothetical protein [Desulfurispira natronophila]
MAVIAKPLSPLAALLLACIILGVAQASSTYLHLNLGAGYDSVSPDSASRKHGHYLFTQLTATQRATLDDSVWLTVHGAAYGQQYREIDGYGGLLAGTAMERGGFNDRLISSLLLQAFLHDDQGVPYDSYRGLSAGVEFDWLVQSRLKAVVGYRLSWFDYYEYSYEYTTLEEEDHQGRGPRRHLQMESVTHQEKLKEQHRQAYASFDYYALPTLDLELDFSHTLVDATTDFHGHRRLQAGLGMYWLAHDLLAAELYVSTARENYRSSESLPAYTDTHERLSLTLHWRKEGWRPYMRLSQHTERSDLDNYRSERVVSEWGINWPL